MNLYKMVNDSIEVKDLISFSELLNIENLENKLDFSILTKEQINDCLNYLEVDISDLYISKKGFTPFFYYKSPIFIGIDSISIDFLKTFHIKEKIKAQKVLFEECLVNKDFYKLFSFTDKRIAFSVYEEMYPLIPDYLKYEIFIELYVENDYGFQVLSNNFIREIFSFQTEEQKNKVYKIIKKHLENEYLQIYRGESSESTPYLNAFSWTTDIGIACKFATRDKNNGRVYKANVHYSKIIDYITSRNESEVIVSGSDVEEVILLDFYNYNQAMDMLKENELLNDYIRLCNEISSSWFFKPNGEHGVNHTKRVLFYSLLLSCEYSLNISDIDILSRCSLYHDIGRENDDEDPEHGEVGLKKVYSLGLPSPIQIEDKNIMNFIISNHHINDTEGISNICYFDIHDKQRAIKLYKIFKDADGLDRVRFDDLNINYLRYQNSHKFIMLAYTLLRIKLI